MVSLLTNTNAVLRSDAAHRICKLGKNAAAAVPALLNSLAHPDARVREDITNVLRDIAPAALANAAPK